jgi:pyridoxal 5'-phosphate synthase pdxT subunit
MVMPPLVVGVLALQGAFAKHIEVLKSLGAESIEVRKPADLLKCDALIIPGGESTTIMKQMKFIDFIPPFLEFSQKKPVFGTCAGLILISQTIIGDAMQPFQLIDVDVERNAFGRQVESFHTELELCLKPGQTKEVPAFFIRAPRIRRVGELVKVISALDSGEPVLIRQGNHLGATFHPELTHDSTIHAYFLSLIAASKK